MALKEVKTSDIYWGALPFVGIHVLMVAVVLAFPQTVLRDQAADASIVKEIPIQADPDGNYLPLEWP